MKNTEKTSLLEEDRNVPGEEEEQQQQQQQGSVGSRIKGIVALLLYTITQSTSKICVQALDRSVPDFGLNSLRCGFATVGMALYFLITRNFPRVPKDNIPNVFLLCLVSNLVTIGIYVTLTFIPIASAECLILTTYLITGLVFFTAINKEKLRWDKLVSVPLSVTGVILVLQPSFIFVFQETLRKNTEINPKATEFSNQVTLTQENNNWPVLGYILATCTGLFMTLEVAVVKYYKDFFTTENVFISLIWSYLLGTLLSIIPMLIYEDPVFPVDIKNILLLCAHVCTYVFMLPLLLYGSLLVSGSLGSIIGTTNLILVLIAQYTLLRDIHPGHRNWIEIVGVMCVLFGSIFSSLVEILKSYRKEEDKKCTQNRNTKE